MDAVSLTVRVGHQAHVVEPVAQFLAVVRVRRHRGLDTDGTAGPRDQVRIPALHQVVPCDDLRHQQVRFRTFVPPVMVNDMLSDPKDLGLEQLAQQVALLEHLLLSIPWKVFLRIHALGVQQLLGVDLPVHLVAVFRR